MADDTLLTQGAIQQRMRCTGSVAANIESTFTTVEKLVDAVESDDPLTDVNGIGPATAETIMEWYENRADRERAANETTVTPTSSKSMRISFHGSWEDALGIEVPA